MRPPITSTGTGSRAGRFLIVLPLLYMAGIYHLSSISGAADAQATPFHSLFVLLKPNVQNFLHIPLFGVLAWLWHFSLSAWTGSSSRRSLLALTISFGYGILDELHQALVPGRFASLTDVALNGLGALVAVLLLFRHSKKLEFHSGSGWLTR